MSSAPFELPGMIEHSREAFDAGCSEGLSSWRGTFPFGVTVTIQASGIEDALRRLGPEALLIEDLDAPCDCGAELAFTLERATVSECGCSLT